MRRPFIYIPGLIILLYFVKSCSSLIPVSSPEEDSSLDLYKPSMTKIHPVFLVYHNQSNSSELTGKIFPSELLFNQTNDKGMVMASFRIEIIIWDITDDKNKLNIDTVKASYEVTRNDKSKRFYFTEDLPLTLGKKYQLKVKTTDSQRRTSETSFIYVDKQTVYSQQNFKVVSSQTQNPFFPPYVVGNNEFVIQYRKDLKYIYVSYYINDFSLPKPTYAVGPSISTRHKPDSVWILPYAHDLSYKLYYEGIYFVQIDTALQEGLTLLNFNPYFPKIKEAEQMLDPLAYLSTAYDYEQLQNAANKKLAVDNFWLEKTRNNTERARELIRVYYNRVYLSNYYFTSFIEGWKTDRGMIYMVYGPPHSVFKKGMNETWVYFRKNYSSSITFVFVHKPLPYSFENYELRRSEGNDWHWRDAVDSWRRGKVFFYE